MKDGIRLICRGKATPASRLVPIGINMVDRMREVDEYGFQQFQVSDTERVEAKLSGGHAVITIWSDGEEEGEQCPEYMSGMTQYNVNAVRYDSQTGEQYNGLWGFSPSSAYAADNKLPNGWQMGKYGRVPASAISEAPQFDPNAGTSVPSPWQATGWTQGALLKPGLYSGIMRQVVQILLGGSFSIGYRYDFYCTHGVYRAVDAEGKPADLLIEISQQNGVIAMEMPACTKSVPKANTLGYVPLGGSFPSGAALQEAIKAGTVKVLLPPEALHPVYSRSPFSGLFGWAFDYEGKRASVVVYDSPGQYIKTYLYTLSISPGGASLALEISDNVVCAGYGLNGYSVGAFKVPRINGGAAEPVGLGPNYGTYSPAECLAPLHVWYEQSGERQIVWYENGEKSYGKRPSDERRINDRPVGVPKPSDYVWMSEEGNLNVQYVEYPDTISGQYWYQTNQRVYIKGNRPDDDVYTPSRMEYMASATDSYVTRLSPFGSRPWDDGTQISTLKLVRLWTSSIDGYAKTYRSSVVIPSFEREGAIACVESRWNYQTKTSLHVTYMATGKVYTYDGTPPDGGWYSSIDSDGLPNAGTETCKFPSDDDTWSVPQYPLNSESYESNGGMLGAWVKRSFGGLGSNYGSSDLPVSFTWRDSWPARDSDAVMASFLPLSLFSSSSGKFSGTSAKYLVCADGVIPLRLESGENYYDADAERSADYLFFHVEGWPVYPLIQSWDGKLRYSPSKLNEKDFDNSKFGEYQPHDQQREFSINFVGDA